VARRFGRKGVAVEGARCILLVLSWTFLSVAAAGVPQWIPVGPEGAAYAVAAPDPGWPDRVYVGAGNELYLSIDGGQHFARLPGALPIGRTDISPLPFVQSLVVLRPEAAVFPPLPPRLVAGVASEGIYYSVDGGKTFAPGVFPVSGNTLLPPVTARKLVSVRGNDRVVYAQASTCLDRSVDGGATWNPVPIPWSPSCGDIDVIGADGQQLFLGNEEGIFQTIDGGAHWTRAAQGLPPLPYGYGAHVASDPANPGSLFAVIGRTGTYQSTDSGATWVRNGDAPPGYYWASLTVAGSTLWAIESNHNQRSQDGGRTWVDVGNGSDYARDAQTGRLYARLPGNLGYSTDNGTTWHASESGLQGIGIEFIAVDASGATYAMPNGDASVPGRLLRRMEGAIGWRDASPPGRLCFGYFSGTDYPKPVLVIGDRKLVAFAGGTLWRSDDAGDHWVGSGGAVGCLMAAEPDHQEILYTLTPVLYGHAQIIVATTIRKTTDGGLTWTDVAGLPTITNRIFAGGSGRLLADTNDGLRFSGDGGLTWALPSRSLPSGSVVVPVGGLKVRDVAADLLRANVLVAAADDGIYRSSDGGANLAWTSALPDATVVQVVIRPGSDSVVYAIAAAGQVFRSDDGGTTWGRIGLPFANEGLTIQDVVMVPQSSSLYVSTNLGVYQFVDRTDVALAVEFSHPQFDHYFVTAYPEESAMLGAGGLPPWVPTGQTFHVQETDAQGASDVCRFFSGQTFAPKSSHFYTPYADECAYLRQQGKWQYEGDAFGLGLPSGPAGQGTCPAGSAPLYRLYNNGQGGAPNHRYTTDPAVLDVMIAQGWVMEGEAITRVFACVPR
jgi:photosystem II stability/assembly factor-like uncharacterized protein